MAASLVAPPSTSCSKTMSASSRPTCGSAPAVLSILTVTAGRSGMPSDAGSPVSGSTGPVGVGVGVGVGDGLGLEVGVVSGVGSSIGEAGDDADCSWYHPLQPVA